mmetsp:Transcript_54854/g.117110  ORF Transcript_54854/g.117110 Transcript_54854/m.117110 type:complete len:540 (+) Transcript_54854:240-1859(+)
MRNGNHVKGSFQPPPLNSEDIDLGCERGPALSRSWSIDSGAQVVPFGLLEAPSSRPNSPVLTDAAPRPDMPLLFKHAAEGTAAALAGSPNPKEAVKHTFGQRLRKLIAFTGPGWLMSIAYVDPGNLEADLQCGAQFGYLLLWVLLGATGVGLGMQLVAARLGCVTRQHLAEHCRMHYAKTTRIFLWLLMELAIVGSDIQEVIGGAIGLQLLFGLPLCGGVLITAFAAFGFLFLERFGTHFLEMFFGVLILILALSMGGLFALIKPDTTAVLEGFFLPRLPESAVSQAVGMVGCIIMPHNLYLHSALVQSRVVEPGEEQEAITLFSIESSVAILTSVLINASVVAVFAKGFYGSDEASHIGLKNAGSYLGHHFGDGLRIIWGLGLCAAGQSSTMTGAYAGQWVMQGYLQLKVKPWKRAVITRSMALLPTLAVAAYFGSGNAGLDTLNSYLNILQSLVLPFAVVPLLTFAGSSAIMGDFSMSAFSRCLAWAAAGAVMLANTFLLLSSVDKISFLVLAWVLLYIGAVVHVFLATKVTNQEDA